MGEEATQSREKRQDADMKLLVSSWRATLPFFRLEATEVWTAQNKFQQNLHQLQLLERETFFAHMS